ncbi:hypothetical protein [Actinomadura sp. SCN-SB]|uniref:hypothetical protein n=1 Tax=Actinomadura sp. SCN-SB TaxID=3373092 RepID=UPI00375105DE
MSTDPVTADDVLRVASYRDRAPARQAMVIAHVYHLLARDLGTRAGRDEANWFAFATWSSKAIAEGLDLSDGSPFLAGLAARLGLPPWCGHPFRALTLRLLGPSYQLGLTLANRMIFLETGSLAAGLWRDGRAASPAVRPRRPRPGEPVEVRPVFLSDLVAPADEAYLDAVSSLLTRAAGTRDARLRAELVFGANIAMSAYEQARAQKALELVLYRPVRWVMRASWRTLLAMVMRRPFHRLALYTQPHESVPWPVRVAESLWARLYTRYMGTLRTPVSEIRLSKPLRPPPGAAAPPLTWQVQDAEVRKLVETFVPDPERAEDGVADWLDYPERMRFIVAYFRAYLAVPELFGPPYGPPLAAELEAEAAVGTLPEPVRSAWFRKKIDRYEDRAKRPGLRGWVVRRFYRSPVQYDPDALELARIDLGAHATARTTAPEPRP